MFVETCGHYDAYINTQQDGEKIFQVRGIAAFHILSVATHSDRSATHPAKSHTSHVWLTHFWSISCSSTARRKSHTFSLLINNIILKCCSCVKNTYLAVLAWFLGKKINQTKIFRDPAGGAYSPPVPQLVGGLQPRETWDVRQQWPSGPQVLAVWPCIHILCAVSRAFSFLELGRSARLRVNFIAWNMQACMQFFSVLWHFGLEEHLTCKHLLQLLSKVLFCETVTQLLQSRRPVQQN